MAHATILFIPSVNRISSLRARIKQNRKVENQNLTAIIMGWKDMKLYYSNVCFLQFIKSIDSYSSKWSLSN